MNIPEKYYRGENQPIVNTVGALKAALAELPDDLQVKAGFAESVKIIVYNHGLADEHLELVEPYEDEDEDA